MRHHTKDKGDLGVLKAHADLAAQGFLTLVPLTEHAPFDLVAYRPGQFFRIQVRYRTLGRFGSLNVSLRRSWCDSHGVHTERLPLDEIDLICVYCPETDACYYFNPVGMTETVYLRLRPARNGRKAGLHFAEDYRFVPPCRLAGSDNQPES